MHKQRQDDIRQAGLRSRAALAWLRDHHLPAEPICYTVAYEYLFTDNEELKIQVDSLDFGEVESKDILEQIYKISIIDKHYDELGMKCNNASKYVSEALALLLDPVQATSHSAQKSQVANNDSEGSNAPIELESSPDLYLEIKESASIDPLTMALDQKGVTATLNEAITHSENLPVSVIRLDIDHFKHFDGIHGRKMSDAAIKQAARMMQNQLKGSDIISRYEEDEFLVALPRTAIKHGLIVADIIRKKIEGLTLRRKGSNLAAKFTVSAGVSEYSGKGNLENVLKCAHYALTRSKDSGRNCVNQELPG